MNFRKMYLNIKEFCPKLSIPVIKERINIRYQQILAAEDWEFLYDTTTVRLVAIHESLDGETVQVAQGDTAVTGTGTTFTSAHEGYYIRFGSDSQPYVVSSVTDTTHLVLETAYGDDSDSSMSYSLYPRSYSPSVGDVGEILSIAYNSKLGEVSEGFLYRLDPERDSTGEPTYYRIFSKSKADQGTVSFEVWPIPDEDYVVTVSYKRTVSALSEDTDEPVFRPELLEAGALWDCYRMCFNLTQNPAFMGMARDSRNEYDRLMRDMLLEDLRTASIPQRIRSFESDSPIWNNEYYIDHDTEPW